MSVEITTLVKLARLPNATLKAVAWAMADYANRDGAGIYPSNQTLADDTALNRRTVIEAIAALEEAGIVATDTIGAGGHYRNTSIRTLSTERLLALSRGNAKLGIAAGRSTYVVSSVTIDGKRRDVHAVIDLEAAAETEARLLKTRAARAGGSGPGPLVSQDHQWSRTTAPVSQDHCTSGPRPPNPSGNRQGTTLPLPPPVPAARSEGEGCGKAVDELGTDPEPPVQAAAELSRRGEPAATSAPLPRRWRPAAEALATVEARVVAAAVLEPLIGTLAPPHDADPAAYVRQLVDVLGRCSPAVLERIRLAIRTERVRDMPPVPWVQALRDRLVAAERLDQRAGAAMAALDLAPLTDVEATRWARIRAHFAASAGTDPDHALLARARPLGLGTGKVVIVVPDAGIRAALDLGHSARLRDAIEAVEGRGTAILIETVQHRARVIRLAPVAA